MLSPSVQLRLLWESWDQAAAGAERPQGGRWRLELCDEMMEPPSAKKKDRKESSRLPWSSVLDKFLQEAGTRGGEDRARQQPSGVREPGGGTTASPSPEDSAGPWPDWRGRGGQGLGAVSLRSVEGGADPDPPRLCRASPLPQAASQPQPLFKARSSQAGSR